MFLTIRDYASCTTTANATTRYQAHLGIQKLLQAEHEAMEVVAKAKQGGHIPTHPTIPQPHSQLPYRFFLAPSQRKSLG